MKHDLITQRLKGLISNFEKLVNVTRFCIPFEQREYATSKYQFILCSTNNSAWILDMIFRTETEKHNDVLPLEDQTVLFKFEEKTHDGYAIESHSTAPMSLTEARNALKELNKALKHADTTRLGQYKCHIMSKLMAAKPYNNESKETEFDSYINKEKVVVLAAKENYYNATEKFAKARNAAQAEINDSEELKLVERLQEDLRKAQESLNNKSVSIHKKHETKELYKAFSVAKELWEEHSESFYSKALRKLLEFNLSISVQKRYKDITNIDKERIKIK